MVPPFGLFGATDGLTHHYEIVNNETERVLGSKEVGVVVNPGDHIIYRSGGGGYGLAEERDSKAAAWELNNKHVTEWSMHRKLVSSVPLLDHVLYHQAQCAFLVSILENFLIFCHCLACTFGKLSVPSVGDCHMKTLDVQLIVSGRPSLDETTRRALMVEKTLQPLSHSLAKRIFGQIVVGDYVLRAQIGETGIIITDDWVVLIQGPSLLYCVAALCALISLVTEVVGASVAIKLLTSPDSNRNPLHRHLARISVVTGAKRVIIWALGSAVTVVASAAVGFWLAQRFG